MLRLITFTPAHMPGRMCEGLEAFAEIIINQWRFKECVNSLTGLIASHFFFAIYV